MQGETSNAQQAYTTTAHPPKVQEVLTSQVCQLVTRLNESFNRLEMIAIKLYGPSPKDVPNMPISNTIESTPPISLSIERAHGLLSKIDNEIAHIERKL